MREYRSVGRVIARHGGRVGQCPTYGSLAKRIREAIQALADDPRPPGCRKLEGRNDEWRVRVGTWRVVYRIEDGRLVVVVVRIAPRGEVYW